ncbi:MAG: hypothetical protein Q9166_004726 [cf. Caloplaca sp. 2 TL-2023]
MARKLNVIGFISGGKDSFFSLLHCLANGHQVIALANLYPPSPTDDNEEDFDLNSLMYQTVGHSLVPLYAEITSIPLYRQEISGTAINQAKDYSVRHDGSASSTAMEDETESMTALLDRIKADHPEANAVCSGAILSTYQRSRIESVALRMHLVPIAYMWQYPDLPMPVPRKEGLLEDMAAVGLHARIVKVASGGLDEHLLWANVCAAPTRKKIAGAMNRFGGSVLGEGGEFETLVCDGPMGLFKGAIEVEEKKRKIVRAGGGEAFLKFAAGGVVKMKETDRNEDGRWLEKLRIPDLLDKASAEVLEMLDNQKDVTPVRRSRLSLMYLSHAPPYWTHKPYIRTGRWTTRISNISASDVGDNTQAQMQKVNYILMSVLEEVVHRSVSDIVFTTILLRSMDDFQAVNQRYTELFGTRPNPPARVTVACGNNLPSGVNVILSVIVALGSNAACQHLHVQSMSYWAPANIGPYSQATSLPQGNNDAAAVVYVAGQIPLVPATMEIVTRAGRFDNRPDLAAFRLQTTLALQHLWRIGRAMKTCWWVGAIAFIVAGEDGVREKAATAGMAWTAFHTPRSRNDLTGAGTQTVDSDFDVWNQQRADSRSFMNENDEDLLPNISRLSITTADGAEMQDGRPVVPPFFAVEVAQLPRDSQIEWQALGITRAFVRIFDTVIEDGHSIKACSMTSYGKTFGFVAIRSVKTESEIYTQIEQATLALQERCSTSGIANGHTTIYTALKVDSSQIEAQLIPCKSVWSIEGEELAAATVVEYEIGSYV